VTIQSINLLVKPTLACNARCLYCHSLKPTNNLSIPLLEHLLEKLAAFTNGHNIANVSMNWHGGEPMLMGSGFYETVMELEKRFFPHTQIRHTMQSNVCLYTGETRETLLKLMHARIIGACLDPFHPTRLTAQGTDSFPQSLKGTLALLRDGFFIGMIYVVHKKSLEVVEDLYYFFKNLGVPSILFHPLEEFGNPDYHLTPQDYGEFLKRLWDVWEEDDYEFNVSPLAEWRRFLRSGQPCSSCEYGAPSRESPHIVVSPEGDLYPCHRFQDKRIHCMGNIGDLTFEEILSHPWAHLLSDSKENLCSECAECEYVSLCRSGCVATHDRSGKTFWCEGLKKIFEYVKSKESFGDADVQCSHAVPGCI